MTYEKAEKIYNELFNEEDKAKAFDEIAKKYYYANFGSTTKSDLDVLMFHLYIEQILNQDQKNYEAYSDYTLSKQLGITQSRVRSLKERKEFKYPHEGFEWKESFAESVQYAKYDDHDHFVKIIIQDVNVMNEIRHYIEMHGWYDECSLNRKLLKIPLDCFIEICLDEKEDMNKLFSDSKKKEIQELGKGDSVVEKFVRDFSKEGLKTFLMSASKEVIKSTLSLLPFGGIAKIAFDSLLNIMEGM